MRKKRALKSNNIRVWIKTVCFFFVFCLLKTTCFEKVDLNLNLNSNLNNTVTIRKQSFTSVFNLMPRKYKIKERRYNISMLEEAIHSVLLREMNPSQASRAYRVPRMTIVNHVNGRSKGFHRGRHPVFSHDQEK